VSVYSKGQDSKNPKGSVHELIHQVGIVPVKFKKVIPTSDTKMSPTDKKKGLHHLKYEFNLKTYIKNKIKGRGGVWARKSESTYFQSSGKLSLWSSVPTMYHEVQSSKVEEQDIIDDVTLSTQDGSPSKKLKLDQRTVISEFSQDLCVKEEEGTNNFFPDSFLNISFDTL